MLKRVADIVVDTLLELGVNDCFCVVGGGAMHLNNAFKINNLMRVTYCHHEQACAFAAEGYTKYSGKIATVSVTSGPGAVNALNGVYSAYVDNTPMIVVAGHPRYDTTIEACGLNLRCRGVQEYDIISSVKGMTKYAKMVLEPLRIKEEITRAYRIAMDGRRGPVWLSIPLDIQASMVEEEELLPYVEGLRESGTDDNDVAEKVIQMFQEAKRPCILAGSAIRSADAMDGFLKLIDKLNVPVIGESLAADLLPRGYKNFYGLSGSTGPRIGNYILQEADLILVLGNSLSTRQTGFNVDAFAPNAKFIMVDIEKDEFLKPGLHIDFPICMDINYFFDIMDAKLQNTISCAENWKAFCNKIYQYFLGFDIPEVPAEGTIPEKLFWDVFLDKLEEDALIALGNSNCAVGVLQLGIRRAGQRVVTNCNAGSMGYDLPEAVGIAVASGQKVYCVTGDGSVMMNIQELETIKYNNLPVKVIVFSNHGYGAIRQTCRNYFNGVYAGCDSESGVDFPDFEKLAEAFGFPYMHCGRFDELEQSLAWLMSLEGRCILEIDEDMNDTVIPKIMSKMRSDGSFETPSFTGLFPFVSEKDQKYVDECRGNL